MPTFHFHETTTSTPEHFIAGLTDFGPGRSTLFGNSADKYLKVHDRVPPMPTSRRARTASGSVCTTTGLIPTAFNEAPAGRDHAERLTRDMVQQLVEQLNASDAKESDDSQEE